MKKGCLVLSIILAIIGVIAIAILVIIDQKYEVIFPARQTPHSDIMPSETRALAVVDLAPIVPQLLQLIATQQPDTEVPEWVVRQMLPYQVALFAEPDRDVSRLNIQVYCNARRAGPILVDLINRANLDPEFPMINWDSAGLQSHRKGVLLKSGSVDVPAELQDLVYNIWAGSLSLPPLDIQGGNALEVVLDNRDGGAYEVVAAFAVAMGADLKELIKESVTTHIPKFTSARLQADWRPDNVGTIHLELQCVKGEREGVEFMVGLAIQFIADRLKYELDQNYGCALEGDFIWEDDTLVADYTISDVARIFLP